jgi:pimeloyl-ACP methyl ester carboxylesterase
VVGARDEKFRALAARTGRRTVVVEGAGHNVIAERPDRLAQLLEENTP